MSDGNSNTDGQPTNNVSAPHIMSSLEPGAFGLTQITSPIVNGGPGEPDIVMQVGDVPVHHHPVRLMPNTMPTQENLDGEK